MFNQRAFLGQVPIVGMGQPRRADHTPDFIANLRVRLKRALERGDDEDARYWQHRIELWEEDFKRAWGPREPLPQPWLEPEPGYEWQYSDVGQEFPTEVKDPVPVPSWDERYDYPVSGPPWSWPKPRPGAIWPRQPSNIQESALAPTPSTPTAQASQYQWRETPQYQGTPLPGTPTASQAAAQGGGGCPPGQFRASPGGPCRGSVGAMPSIPGGLLNTATAATATLAPTSMPATSFTMGRAMLGQVRLVKRGF